ncbi:hypothetical protein BaRGS_00003354 [Batillaria attramentaria]|uniref:Carbonic anhydrase n=1 Tax=Batillaria attramentaria TaxID=370345 RepID=A0ABD0M0N3_9CAEN
MSGVLWLAVAMATVGLTVSQRVGPGPGEGFRFFRNYAKCEQIGYCYEYNNPRSCVNPPNWVCVHTLNREAGTIDESTQTRGSRLYKIQEYGLGNTRCCGGRHQSPINIPSRRAVCVRNQLTPNYREPRYWWDWKGFGKGSPTKNGHRIEGVLENTGTYLNFKVEERNIPKPLVLRDVPFTDAIPLKPNTYVFAEAHIHTGVSEHRVNGRAYDGEIHMVHRRTAFFNFDEQTFDQNCSSQTPLGIAVIGIFLSILCHDQVLSHGGTGPMIRPHPVSRIGPLSGPGRMLRQRNRFCLDQLNEGRRNAEFDAMIKEARAGSIQDNPIRDNGNGNGEGVFGALFSRRKRAARFRRDEDDKKIPFTMNPAELLPRSDAYYQYFGSLTSPPCTEVLNWIVMKEPIRITRDQLEFLQNFRSFAETGAPVRRFGNSRPIQPRNGRTVTTNRC